MSKLEQMTYKMQPAGHEEPPAKRKYTREGKLDDLCLKWLKFCRTSPDRNANKWYNYGRELLDQTNVTVDEANALTLKFADHINANNLGIFLSVAYNKSPDKEIVYDLTPPQPPHLLGYKLPKNKTLIIKGTVSDSCGNYAKGNIVNLGNGGLSLGHQSSGIIINYDTVEAHLGQSSSGTVLNFGKAKHTLGHEAKGLVINLGYAEEYSAYECETVAINFGSTGKGFGFLSRGIIANSGHSGYELGERAKGIVISTQTPPSWGDLDTAKAVVRYDYSPRINLNHMKARMQEIHQYLDNLKIKFEKGRKDYKTALEVLKEFGTKPGQTISNDIENILKRAGYHV